MGLEMGKMWRCGKLGWKFTMKHWEFTMKTVGNIRIHHENWWKNIRSSP